MAAFQEAWLAISADSQSTRNKLVQWQAETSVQAAIREDRNRSCTTGIRTDQSLRFHPPGGSPAQPKDGHRKTSVMASAQPLRWDVTNVANSLCAFVADASPFLRWGSTPNKKGAPCGTPLASDVKKITRPVATGLCGACRNVGGSTATPMRPLQIVRSAQEWSAPNRRHRIWPRSPHQPNLC